MKIQFNIVGVLFMTFMFTSLSAQKFGHLNTAVVIEMHPAVASANTELETYRKGIMESFETKVRSFESRYMFFMEEVNAGTLSRVSAQTRQQELQKEQEALGTEEQQLQFAVMQKREELLQPILTEVDSVIQLIGQEGKYTMIFDTSVNGALLWAEESDDLTELVKARLKKG